MIESNILLSNKTFDDGTPNIKIKDVDEPPYIAWQFSETDWAGDLFRICCICDAWERLTEGKRKLTLFVPYLPNARQDRIRNPCECFTLKTICDILNRYKFLYTVTIDVHSDVACALLERNRNIDIKTVFEDTLVFHPGTCDCIIFPDAGAEHKYSWLFKGRKTYVGSKTRDWETQWVTGYTLPNSEELKGCKVVIVDDIIGKGYTMKFLIEELVRCGVKTITLAVPHIQNSGSDSVIWGKDADWFRYADFFNVPITLYTTNSTVHTFPRILKNVNHIFETNLFCESEINKYLSPIKDNEA